MWKGLNIDIFQLFVMFVVESPGLRATKNRSKNNSFVHFHLREQFDVLLTEHLVGSLPRS